MPLESTFLMVKFLSITKFCWLNQYKTTIFIVNSQLLDGEVAPAASFFGGYEQAVLTPNAAEFRRLCQAFGSEAGLQGRSIGDWLIYGRYMEFCWDFGFKNVVL